MIGLDYVSCHLVRAWLREPDTRMAATDHPKGDHIVNVRSVFVLSAIALISACATPSKGPELAKLPIEATVVWGNQGRGGAAERLPGYVHALHRGGVVYRAASASPELLPNAAFGGPTVSMLNTMLPTQYSELLSPPTEAAQAAVPSRDAKPESFGKTATTSMSDKRRRAWEKYCDGAYGMTDEEWNFVREAGAPDNVPADLAGRCIHPK